MDCSLQSPLSLGFSRQKYWSGLPFPTLGCLPKPGIKHVSLASPALAVGFCTTALPGKTQGAADRVSSQWWPCLPASSEWGDHIFTTIGWKARTRWKVRTRWKPNNSKTLVRIFEKKVYSCVFCSINLKVTPWAQWIMNQLIAYSQRCQICDLWRFGFRIRGQSLIIQSFCVVEVLLQWKKTKKASDIDIRRGTEKAPLSSLIETLYTFIRSTPATYILN